MHIVRFRAEDGRVYLGEDHGDGSATRLLDPLGVLGPFTRTAPHERLRGRHALVADDDDGMRELMSTTLSRAGCACTVCADGAEAVHVIEHGSPDLIVSDIAMPHRNGYEIFTAARARRANTPVVLVTGFGYDPNHAVVKASAEGCDSVLYKPFSPPQLLDEVDRALRGVLRRPSESLVPVGEPVPIGHRLAPIEPVDIICIGRNWGGAGYDGDESAEALEVFLKPTASVQDPGGPIRLPSIGDGDPRLACEGELAVIIGRASAEIDPDNPLDSVVGFTAANDVTARRWQTPEGAPLWMRGKGFATFCPLGPTIVTADAMPAIDDVTVRTRVNGRVQRTGRVGDMRRSIPAIIRDLAKHVTLRPGTVVLTGAPPLTEDETDGILAGDEVIIEIDGLPPLVSHVAPAEHAP